MMKKYSLFLILILALSAITTKSYASHYSSGELRYEYIGDSTGVANQYRLYCQIYLPMSSITLHPPLVRLCVESSCGMNDSIMLSQILATGANLAPGSTVGAWRINGFDVCADSAAINNPYWVPRYVAYKYEANVILPACADYTISLTGQCCRDQADNFSEYISFATNLYLETTLNNTLGPNSSPQIITPVGKSFCVAQVGQAPVIYPQTAIDEDGDSLVYSLVNPQYSANPRCGPGLNIPLDSGFTSSNPLPSHTGMTLNQNNGILSFSPSQQGDYVLSLSVKEYRFDTISLQWLNIGSSIRDFIVPVRASCNPQITSGPLLKIDSSKTFLNNLLKTEMDSLKSAYGISILKGSDSLGNGSSMITKLPFYYGYTCFDSVLDLNFTSTINYNSLKTTDFRLIGPDGVPRPIVGIKNLNQTSVISKVQLMLHQPLDLNGNYLLQIRRGSDANTFLNSCGFAVAEFYGALVVVDSCPQPSYNLNSVSVNNNKNTRLQWEVDNDFYNSSLQGTFNSWIIHRRDINDNLMKPIKVIQDPSARIFVDSALPAGSALSNTVYDYSLLLMYNGKRREMTPICSTIKLNAAPSGPAQSKVFLSWNHYNCIDPLSRAYKIYRGTIDTLTNNISWQQLGDMTSHNNLEVNLNSSNPLPAGSYVYKVVAQDQKNNSSQGLSESNWIYFYHAPQASFSGKNGKKLQIPNIITPNGDQINDRFYIELPTNDSYFTKIHLSIYKRNGELLYENKNYQNINNGDSGWNGLNSSGEALSSGVYYYTIEVQTADSTASEYYQGSITIGT